MIKCLIIGGGPAGCTAAIYAARAAMDPVVIEGPEPGGQLTTTTLVENYPGFKNGIDANELMFAMKAQAENLGAKFMRGRVVSCDLSAKTFTLDDGSVLEAQTVVVATGASAKYLGLPSEKKFRGLGVSACATCDGFFYRGRKVAVVGGGDTACEEAMYLSGLAKEVHMIVRKPFLRASQASQARVFATPNITVHFETVTREILGDESGVTGARFEKNGEVFDIALDGFFLAIGRHPNAEWLGGQLETDENGYIVSDGVKTAVPGVFVAGDVRSTDFRQAITAAADGCRAALEAEKYLKNEL
ncbi:MAG: thioredoxin-disulfide reductase [Bacteroidales bacterium]|nr:thioredoxin-disulfide reductase [Bacteroidales bacterium]